MPPLSTDAAPTPPDKSGGIPWPTILKIVAVVVPLLTGQTVINDIRADAKKDEAVEKSAKVTEKVTGEAYGTVAPTLNLVLEKLKVHDDMLAKLAIEVARATQRKKRAPADTAKVKAKSAETLKAIKEDANALKSALAPLPTTLPPVAEGAKILTPKFPPDAGKQ